MSASRRHAVAKHTQATLDSRTEEVIQDLVCDIASEVDHSYDTKQAPDVFIRRTLKRHGLAEGLFLRRSYDGVTEVRWMVQKMIGKKLANGKARI
jgi:hypothetical protein